MDLALNNLQRLICHKTQQTQLSVDNKHTVRSSGGNYVICLYLKIPENFIYFIKQE